MKQEQGEQTSMKSVEPENVGDVSPGEQLKTARLAQGLSVSDVSNRLKLPIEKIESLESDDVADVAEPVFVAGYLRAYARLLELSEDDVLAGFAKLPGMEPSDSEGESEGAETDAQESNPERMISAVLPSSSAGTIFKQTKPLAMLALIAFLVVAVVYFSLMDTETVDDVQTEPVSHVETEESVEPESTQSSSEMDSQESAVIASTPPESMSVSEAVPSLPESSAVIAADTRVASDEVGPVDESDDNAAAVVVFPQSELRLVFNDESWVDVTDARGEKLVYRLAKAGLSRTVTGVAPFDVQLGYAPGVDIFYNGLPYDMSRYAQRRSARFRVGHAGDRMPNE